MSILSLRRRAADAAAPGRRRRRLWLILSALLVVIVAFAIATAELFVWPQQGIPARVDAVIMLNGPGDRLDTALNLGWEHRTTMLVISRGSQFYGHGSNCAPPIPGVTVICFDPSPATTQGEAEFAGRLARRYHWKTVAVVTITPQITPGRIWLERCLPGVTVYAVAAPLHALAWPPAVLYEWGAVAKAELFDHSC
jgi:hypothetical protein